jgi:hypothetical protein
MDSVLRLLNIEKMLIRVAGNGTELYAAGVFWFCCFGLVPNVK